MSRQVANNILIQLRILGYDAELLQFGSHRRQYAIRLSGYGTFYRGQEYTAWVARIQEYKGDQA